MSYYPIVTSYLAPYLLISRYVSRPTDLHSFKQERDGDTGTYRAQRRGVDNRENTKDAGKRRQVSSKLDGRHIGQSVVIDFCTCCRVLLLT